MAVTTMRDVLRRYGNRIGVNVHPHKLRAQCGVEMIRAGASLSEVRVVLGHACYDTLLPYTAVAADEARSALERMGQAAAGRLLRRTSRAASTATRHSRSADEAAL